MADSRIYDLSNQATEDTSLYLVGDKSGASNAVKILWSNIKTWFKVGDQQYTEENYVTNDETLTASIDALDQAVKDNADDISASVTNLHLAEITLSAADILSLYSIPKTIISAPGANVSIDIISAVMFLNYGTSDYVASTNKLVLRFNGESTGLYEWSNAFIEGSTDLVHKGVISSNVVLKKNTAVELFIENANPTAGDSTMKTYILYRTITTS